MAQDRKTTAGSAALTSAFVAIAAGVGGAILFFLAARGTWAGMLLSYFAPLPLMIATLGFGFAAGGAAVLAGGLAAGLFGSPILGLAVGGGLLLPAYLVCIAALRAPADPAGDQRASRTVMVAMFFSAASALAIVISLIVAHGSSANAHNALTSALLPVLHSVIQEARLPANVTGEELARLLVGIAPAIIAASTFFMLTANAYMAGRVAQISGQLKQPWPQIADTLALPGAAAGLFALSCGLVFIGGTAGVVASIIASALACGFSLVGLAVVHVLSRRLAARTPLLIAVYVLVMCLPPWPLLVLALIGFVDAAFHLRRRYAKPLSSNSDKRTE